MHARCVVQSLKSALFQNMCGWKVVQVGGYISNSIHPNIGGTHMHMMPNIAICIF